MLFKPDNEYISRCLVLFCFPGFKLLLKIVLYYYLINVINQTVLCFLWRVIAVFVFYYLRKIGCCFLLLNCYHVPFLRFVVSSGLIIFKCRSCVSRYGVGQMKGAGGFFLCGAFWFERYTPVSVGYSYQDTCQLLFVVLASWLPSLQKIWTLGEYKRVF